MSRFDVNKELTKLVTEYHHLQNEHQREGQGHWGRRSGAEMATVEQRFEALLSRWVRDDDGRRAWREHLHHRRPAPTPLRLADPPLFRGRSETGSRVEVRPGSDGMLDVVIDGVVSQRVSRLPDLRMGQDGRLRVGGQVFSEAFDAPETAREAFQRHVDAPVGPPPWSWLRELYEDGLVDPDFGLTPRGRRLIAYRRGILPEPSEGRLA
jgi:hypothetical protein